MTAVIYILAAFNCLITRLHDEHQHAGLAQKIYEELLRRPWLFTWALELDKEWRRGIT